MPRPIALPAARAALAALALALALAPRPALAQPGPAAPIFRFETDELWLNLHHFLYVLGRARNGAADATREAVARAPGDAERGLARATADERRRWDDAVAFYAGSPSRADAIFDDSLTAVTRALAEANDRPALTGLALDPTLAAMLERAAPVYRRLWWPAHRESNRGWREGIAPLLDRHGGTILDLISRAYGMPWPAAGYPVHLSGYANWAGAYSTTGDLLVVSTLDTVTRGSLALDVVFHEAMHQWDDAVFELLRGHARRIGTLVPRNLSHAMIFMTAGEAVRRAIPAHTPYADVAGIWGRGMAPFRPALEEHWRPYLAGRGTRDEALAALVAATATQPRPGSGTGR